MYQGFSNSRFLGQKAVRLSFGLKHGFTKAAMELLISPNRTAKGAKRAKNLELLGVLCELRGSKSLPDINLVKPCDLK